MSYEQATRVKWWRQSHVVADIICGLAIFGFAVWAASNASRLSERATQPVA